MTTTGDGHRHDDAPRSAAHPSRALRLVISRELRESARRRSLWITALIVLIGSTALVVLPEILGGGNDEHTITTIGAMPPDFAEQLQSAARTLEVDLETTTAADRSALDASVRDGEASIGVDFTNDPPTVVVKTAADNELGAIVQQAITQAALRDELQAQGISADQVEAAFVRAQPQLTELEAEEGGRSTVAFMASLVLYLMILLLTSAVASGIAIEKSKRISEVLLAIVKPTALLFGKIIGVGLIGLMTLLAGALPVIVKLLLGGDLPPGTGVTLAGSAAWFVLGLALYLSAAGGLGALVDRQEQVGSIITPLSIILVAGYLVGMVAAATPVGAVLAIVPFTSPLVMPARLALGEATPIEVVASLGLLVATVAVVGRLATVVYQRAIVRTGRRLTLREVLRSA